MPADPQTDPVTVVEFDPAGRPLSIETTMACYNCDYARRTDTFYYSDAGHNLNPHLAVISPTPLHQPHAIWLAPGVQFGVYDDATRSCVPVDHATAAARNYVLIEELPAPWTLENLFQRMEECGGTVYCTVCDDRYEEEQGCPDHQDWSDDLPGYVGCGAADVAPRDHHPSVLAVLRLLPPEVVVGLRAALAASCYRIGASGTGPGLPLGLSMLLLAEPRHYHVLRNLTEEQIQAARLGVQWLASLEEGVTTEAEQITIGWIDDYLRQQAPQEGP